MLSVLFTLLIFAIVVSLMVWIVQSWNPPPPLRNIVYAVLLVVTIIGLFGVLGFIPLGVGPAPVIFRR